MIGVLRRILGLCKDFIRYFYQSWQSGPLWPSIKAFITLCLFHLYEFRCALQNHHIEEEKMQKLKENALGLYSLLPADSRFSYSVLLFIKNPNPIFFQKCIESILVQKIANLEILIGYTSTLSPEILSILAKFENALRVYKYDEQRDKNQVLDALVEKAKGNFLFVMGEEDWLRPDFFFRYEQTLRLFSQPEKIVLYCNLNTLSEKGVFFDLNTYQQPDTIHFPFFFTQFLARGLLIHASLWQRLQGVHTLRSGANDEDLLLQLDLAGAIFHHIPICLYFLRSNANVINGEKSQTAFVEALQSYIGHKGYDWTFSKGLQENTVRAIPSLNTSHSIQVIIPFKDQKELTLKCVQSVYVQTGVEVKITAIDNRSVDASVAEQIREMGGEVLRVDEPFNYSRLNNIAVTQTKIAHDCDILVFLNNDVELQPDALLEMLRWIVQPSVGMVGCRLHYPDGRLQHGGVKCSLNEKRRELIWNHIEKLYPLEKMNLSKTLGFFDAVTAACAMMKRDIFIDVGGFDEIWYPIGYSDTHLAEKIRSKGLKCFYTPYAVGIHHESISRKSCVEDYENSLWLHEHLKRSKTSPLI